VSLVHSKNHDLDLEKCSKSFANQAIVAARKLKQSGRLFHNEKRRSPSSPQADPGAPAVVSTTTRDACAAFGATSQRSAKKTFSRYDREDTIYADERDPFVPFSTIVQGPPPLFQPRARS